MAWSSDHMEPTYIIYIDTCVCFMHLYVICGHIVFKDEVCGLERFVIIYAFLVSPRMFFK